jgi:hypothetical protein
MRNQMKRKGYSTEADQLKKGTINKKRDQWPIAYPVRSSQSNTSKKGSKLPGDCIVKRKEVRTAQREGDKD